MDASRLLKTGLLAALALAMLTPVASAHTPIYSSDGLVRGVVGLLNEPTVTYQQSGLDICFTENTTARAPLTVDAGALAATLTAPNGQTQSMAIKGQFGRTGCVTFATPFVPTLSGQYYVDLNGTVNGSAIAVTHVAAGGAVGDQANLTFPAVNVPDLLALQATASSQAATIATQRADLAALAAKQASQQSGIDNLTKQLGDLAGQVGQIQLSVGSGTKANSPGAPAAWVLVGLAGLTAFVRRSR